MKIPIYRNDPELCRWHAVDPERQFASPYVFNANNPVNLYDADGRRTHGAPELWQILDYINELNQQMRESSMRDMDDGGQGADNRDLWDDNKEPLREYIADEIDEALDAGNDYEIPSWVFGVNATVESSGLLACTGDWGISDYLTTIAFFHGEMQSIPFIPGHTNKMKVLAPLTLAGGSWDLFVGRQPSSDYVFQKEYAAFKTYIISIGIGVNFWKDPGDPNLHWNIGLHFGIGISAPFTITYVNYDKLPW